MYALGHMGLPILAVLLILRYRRRWEARVDLRFVLLGAMLPDIVDKAVGHIILAGSLDNGRLIAHTLLFAGTIVVIGIAWRNDRVLVLGLAVLAHLALDLMWIMPATLFWPMYGLGFPAIDFELYDWVHTLLNDPYVIFGEISGGGVLLYIAIKHRLYKWERKLEFFKTGRLPRIG